VAGSAAVGLVSPTWLHEIERWLSYVSSPTHRELLQRVLARALHHDPRTLVVVGIGAWIYAALFLVEGVGLWKRRRWAEYLTIVATASFIPFEIYELAKELTATRVSALALNVAIVVYLIARVWRRRRANQQK
jgi:uncharacterized membrane protein (DUF2068 family)